MRDTGEGQAKLLSKETFPPSSEEIIAERRQHEDLCIAEGKCRGIGNDLLGLYLARCLNRAEKYREFR